MCTVLCCAVLCCRGIVPAPAEMAPLYEKLNELVVVGGLAGWLPACLLPACLRLRVHVPARHCIRVQTPVRPPRSHAPIDTGRASRPVHDEMFFVLLPQGATSPNISRTTASLERMTAGGVRTAGLKSFLRRFLLALPALPGMPCSLAVPQRPQLAERSLD